MPAVSRMIRQALWTQLSGAPGAQASTESELLGLNAAVDDALSRYELDPAVIEWEGFDWSTDGSSQNFIFGRVSPQFLDNSTAHKYPFLTIDTTESKSDNRFKYGTFNGPIIALVEIHISWRPSETLPDFSSFGDAFEDAIYTTLNANEAMVQPGWTYNRDLIVRRSPIMTGGRNWTQSLSCPCRFEAFV